MKFTFAQSQITGQQNHDRIQMKTNPALAVLLRAAVTLHLLVLAFALGNSRAIAQATPNPPDRMAYQGYLTDANGDPLGETAPQNYDVIFRIHDDQSAGQVLWGEQQTVTVDKGYFSVLMGEGADSGDLRPLLSDVFTGPEASDRYVGMTVKGIGNQGSDVNIQPRLRLLSSPYTYLAKNSTALVSPNGSNIVSTANGELTINGSVSANSIIGSSVSATTLTGNGSGLTGLTASQIPPLDGSKITGNLAGSKINGVVPDSVLSGNVALRGSANTFSGNQRIIGTLRTGSETGTSQAPNLSGLVIRRVLSTSSTAGQVVARDNKFVLERDGSPGGLRLRYVGPAPIGGAIIHYTGANGSGAAVGGFVALYSTNTGTTQIYTSAQNVTFCKITFGDPWYSSHMTEVTLMRFAAGGNDSSIWIGTVVSSYDQ